MTLFYKILFIFLGKGLFSLPLHNPGRITSILTHINTFISELVFSLGERREEFRMLACHDHAIASRGHEINSNFRMSLPCFPNARSGETKQKNEQVLRSNFDGQ